MRTLSLTFSSCCFVFTVAFAQSFESDLKSLIEASCIRCHDAETQTPLNMEELDYDLSNPDAFRQMVRIFDRVQDREMPPRSEPRPKRAMLEETLASLKGALLEANLAARQNQRVTMRRLTRLEYEYTLHDLLGIHDALGNLLPAESDSASFDTVAAEQRISPVHVASFLDVADQALDSAIRLGKHPLQESRYVGYTTSPWIDMWQYRQVADGGQMTRLLDDAVVTFFSNDFILRSDNVGLFIGYPGLYRVSIEAYAYQARSPVTMKLTLSNDLKGFTKLLGSIDLYPNDDPRIFEVTTFLQPYDYFNPGASNLDPQLDGTNANKHANHSTYKGEGLAVKRIRVEGPLHKTWPPQRTRQLLTGVEFAERETPRYPTEEPGLYDIKLSKEPIEHVTEIVARLLPLAFRRPPQEGRVEFFTRLAEPAIADGRDFAEVIRIPLRAILSSSRFLFHIADAGELNDFALATRLSYFLWKSMPDDELFQLAREGRLSEPAVLATQVERMLDDEKSIRFVNDFLDQTWRLREIAATTPDKSLYYGFDDLLQQAMLRETQLFFTEMIEENLSVSNLIDSDFTFLNSRLAEHYAIPGVEGQQMRKVALSEDSLRGGLMTQSSILKITADGSSTSPVTRGAFVVTNLLGQPPSPPPASVSFNEPDTRGATTIREQLEKHRDLESCALCHNHIDPPGFAMESFDPVGGFRTTYRRTDGKEALDVDASGISEAGDAFSGIQEFKELLLKEEDEVARHLISQFVIYATGGEIEFADREELSKIVKQTRATGYPVRSIIHAIVQSNLFRSK